MHWIENLLQKSAAPAAPAAAGAAGAAPPMQMPNNVQAPTVNVMGGAGTSAGIPRVAPSQPSGQSAAYAANPIAAMPSAPGEMVVHKGMLMSSEQAQMAAQQDAEAAAAAQELASKQDKAAPTKAPDLGEDWSQTLFSNWDNRLSKISSDPGVYPVKRFPGGTSRYDWNAQGRRAFGAPSPRTVYNPFKPKTWSHSLYGVGKTLLTSRLLNVKPRHWIEREMQGDITPYKQHFARNLMDPVATGSGQNPLLTLGMNLYNKFTGDDRFSPEQLQSSMKDIHSSLGGR